MKVKKFWIKTRVFLSFWFFMILTINIFIFLFYFFVETLFINSVKKDINKKYNEILKEITYSEADIIDISNKTLSELQSLWIFLYIWKNDIKIKNTYKKWFHTYENKNLVFRWDFDNYNIILWKSIYDFENFKKYILEASIFINFFTIITLLIMAYLITNKVLNPLIKLSKYVEEYNIEKNNKLLENIYWDSEIWIITEAVNKLIKKSKNILNSQKKFVADSNHELKTPLMQIETNIELLEEKINDSKVLEKFKSIKKSVENINKIISNLGFTLRWEEEIIKKEQINVWKYLKTLIKDYFYEADKKNIKIKLIEKNKLEIISNQYYLDRLFWNLIQNSIFYNKWKTDIKIIVFKNKVIIKDRGIWMKKEELENIFSRFYRTELSEKYNKNGSWLWLTIVKKICDDFGWEIKIKSEKWAWSEFQIYFYK